MSLSPEIGDAEVEQSGARSDRFRTLVGTLLYHVETGNVSAFADAFAVDATMEWPFAPAGMPRAVHGREEIYAFFGPTRERAISVRTELVNVQALADLEGAVVEYKEDIMFDTGQVMEGRYCALAIFRDDRILHWREYFDSQTILLAGFQDMLK